MLVELETLPSEGSVEAWVAGFAAAIEEAMPYDGFDIVVSGGSAALAAALLQKLPARIGGVVMLDPDDRGDGSAFDPTLCPSGGHLLRLWGRLRFERMRPPRATPEDPATVRGRYESLDLLGRYSWDAVQRVSHIPAWDRLVASLAPDEDAARRSDKVRIVVTGVDRRGKLPPGGGASPPAVQAPGVADRPFATALSIAAC